MIAAPPDNEVERIAALASYAILDTPPESFFDDIVRLAAQICDTPTALLSFVDVRRQWFKARLGMAAEETPREVSFCQHALTNGPAVLYVPDATLDPRFSDSPLVTGEAGIRFYAGAPLVTPAEEVLGVLCVLDRMPRKLAPAQEFALRTLATQVMSQLDLRRTVRQREQEARRLQWTLRRVGQLERIIEHSPVIVVRWSTAPGWRTEYVSSNVARFGYDAVDFTSGWRSFTETIHPDDVERVLAERSVLAKATCSDLKPVQLHYRMLTSNREVRWVRDLTWLIEPGVVGHGVFESIIVDVTEEQARNERLNLLERALQTASVGVVIADTRQPDWPVVYANQAVEKITGYPMEEVVGRNCRFLQGSDRAQPALDELREALREGRDCRVLLRNYRRDGQVFWNELQVAPVRTSNGTVSHFIGVQSDITDMQRATEALHRSEAQYRSLVTNLKEVVFQTDVAGHWTFLNDAWTELTGFTLDESLGQSFRDYVHPDDRARHEAMFAPLLAREQEYCRHEVRYLTRDGGFRWIEVFAWLTFDESGRITGTSGTLTDVSARKEVEESRRRQLAAIEAAIDGVAILDAAGLYTYLNATYLDVFGYREAADLIGRSWREVYGPEEARRFEREVFPQLSAEGKWRGEITARRRDGATFLQEVSMTRIEGGGMVCVCRDLTERQHAQQRIEASLREKDVMLKEIHHRVKNNLQIVCSLLSLQLDELTDPRSRELFMESQNRIASMALVHEKLYQSRDLARIDFVCYLRNLVENLASVQGARGRGITCQLEPGEVFIGIDTAIPCGLIVTELVSNAYKHGFPNGGPGQINVSVARVDDETLRVRIADNGRGLPADFEPARVRSLGMNLVHMLVQQLRGEMTIQRCPGAGFDLVLREVTRRRAAA